MDDYIREWSIEGTLDQLTARLDRPFKNQRSKLFLINRLIIQNTIAASNQIHDEFKNYCAEHTKRVDFESLDGSSWDYIANAGDSIVLRFGENPVNYSAFLTIKLKYSNGVVRFEVDDNGKGIDEEVEPVLFSRDQWSTKRQPPENLLGVTSGRGGDALTQVYDSVLGLGGSVGCQNKGRDKGAIFWYEFPLESIVQTSCK